MRTTKPKFFTSKQFADTFSYDWSYVRKMLKNLPDSKTGNPLHLPDGFRAEKVGRDWLIFPTDDKAVRRLKKIRGA
ncbi:MAG: hypothetical protein C0507_08475 [Cyanobacteria bacterium PR.3.49]|nr:hypothetical protein [Cyanobacteria bacterium PR.3.49]